ncbi:glycosyltransferase [Oxalobacteraceae bacterium A2-2]
MEQFNQQAMKVGILSYPMLFQREGGLQVQVRETIAALRSLPHGARVNASLVDPCRDRLDEYDLVHIFSAINGNHRIAEAAHEQQVPVALSPLLSPGWTRGEGLRARVAQRLAGRITGWQVQTSYAQTKRALQLAGLVIALGEAERSAIMSAFQVAPQRITVLPNGVNAAFFQADGDLFRRHTGLDGPFVLCAGAISPYKNQLRLAASLPDLPVALIGAAQREHRDYLGQLLALPNVHWLGPLEHDDPLLASAYAAASVLALPSQGEVFPLSVMEALAAGTPAVMTSNSSLRLAASAHALKLLPWDDAPAWPRAIRAVVAAPPAPDSVRALVRPHAWSAVAAQLAACYHSLLGKELRHAV